MQLAPDARTLNVRGMSRRDASGSTSSKPLFGSAFTGACSAANVTVAKQISAVAAT